MLDMPESKLEEKSRRVFGFLVNIGLSEGDANGYVDDIIEMERDIETFNLSESGNVRSILENLGVSISNPIERK